MHLILSKHNHSSEATSRQPVISMLYHEGQTCYRFTFTSQSRKTNISSVYIHRTKQKNKLEKKFKIDCLAIWNVWSFKKVQVIYTWTQLQINIFSFVMKMLESSGLKKKDKVDFEVLTTGKSKLRFLWGVVAVSECVCACVWSCASGHNVNLRDFFRTRTNFKFDKFQHIIMAGKTNKKRKRKTTTNQSTNWNNPLCIMLFCTNAILQTNSIGSIAI